MAACGADVRVVTLTRLAKRRYIRPEVGAVKVNMLEAKSQLSRLVKEALEGEEVVIASNGEPLVRLVPVANRRRLRGCLAWHRLKISRC